MKATSFFSRLGCFIFVVGSIALVLGLAAAYSDQPALGLIVVGLLLSVVGFALWNRKRDRSTTASRFSLLKRRKKAADEKKNASDQD